LAWNLLAAYFRHGMNARPGDKKSRSCWRLIMKTCGVKVLDPPVATAQIDWLLVPAAECRDLAAERRLVCVHFRKPHEPWAPEQAFVMPVRVRRSRRRVLFCQESGLRW
jgi:hypothetical protein